MGDIQNGKDRDEVIKAIQNASKNRDFRGYTYEQWIQNYNSDLLGAAGSLFIPGQEKLKEVNK